MNNRLFPYFLPSGHFFQDSGGYFLPEFQTESVFTAMTGPFYIPNDSLGVPVSLFFPLRTHYSLVSCCQDPGSPSKVEGELPEEGVGGIFGDGGKPCPGSVVMEMGDPEVLFDDISDLRDGL
ncbi:MAG: hypothetical protein WDA74_04750, partial [Spirochaetota bacterium]